MCAIRYAISAIIAVSLLGWGLDTSAEEEVCGSIFLSRYLKDINEKIDTEDMSKTIEDFRLGIDRCPDQDWADFGLDRGIYKTWMQRTREHAYKRAVKNLEIKSQTGVDLSAQTAVNHYAKLLSVPNAEVAQMQAKLASQARAAEEKSRAHCSGTKTMDLSSKLGPARNQKEMGWCFAFVAADLLSFRTGQKISAADVAISYYDDFWNNLDKGFKGRWSADEVGGHTHIALEKAQDRGLCLESNVRSEVEGSSTLVKALRSIEAANRKTPHPDCAEEACEAKCSINNARAYFPGLKLGDLADVVEKASKETLFGAMANKACEPRIRPEPKLEFGKVVGQGDSIFDAIDAQLDKDQPVGLNYNAYELNDPETKDFGPHGSVVAGRRFNEMTRQCEYLIRNSYGTNCADGSYDVNLECIDGNIWVPKSVLWESASVVNFIK